MTAESLALDHASTYAAHGLAVFPLKPRDKVPATLHGVKDATKDGGKLQRWFGSAMRDANLAVAAGAVSGVVILDVDGETGLASLRDLLAEHGATLPKTPTVATGKGVHLYFRHPGGVVKNGVALRPGLDVRSDGGYVVAPPSIHPSGDRYEWETPLDVPFAPVPAFLAALFTEQTERPAAAPVEGVVPQGQRRETAFRDACAMRRRGMDEVTILAALRAGNATRWLIQTDDELVDIAHRATMYAPDVEAIRDEEWQDRQRAKLTVVKREERDEEDDDGQEVDAYPEFDAYALAREEDEPLTFLPLLEQDGWLVEGAAHVVSAFPKSGKTTLLAQCVREWLAEGYAVYWLSEESRRTWRRRLHGFSYPPGAFTITPAIGTKPEVALDRAFAKLDEHGEKGILIVDTIRNFFGVEDENDSGQMAAAVKPWLVRARQSGATLIGVHHNRKGGGDNGEGVAGGHGLVGAVDVIVELKRDPSVKTRRLLHVMGRDVEELDGMYERDEDGSLRWLGTPKAVALDEVKARVRQVLEEAEEWLTVAEVLAVLGETPGEPTPSRDSVDRSLKALVGDERAIRDTSLKAHRYKVSRPLRERLKDRIKEVDRS